MENVLASSAYKANILWIFSAQHTDVIAAAARVQKCSRCYVDGVLKTIVLLVARQKLIGAFASADFRRIRTGR